LGLSGLDASAAAFGGAPLFGFAVGSDEVTLGATPIFTCPGRDFKPCFSFSLANGFGTSEVRCSAAVDNDKSDDKASFRAFLFAALDMIRRLSEIQRMIVLLSLGDTRSDSCIREGNNRSVSTETMLQ